MKIKTLLAALATALITAPSAFAATLDFDFSFSQTGLPQFSVTGTVFGLTDNATSAASSVTILTDQGAFTLDHFLAGFNAFTVTNGVLETASFGGFGTNATREAYLSFGINGITGDTEAQYTSTLIGGGFGTGVQGIATFEASSAAPVPLPAGGVLLLTGFGAVAAMRRRKSRTA